MLKAITTVFAGVFLALSSQPLMAVGFGRLVNATTLGQSLDVTVALSADIAEQVTPDCVGAEVVVGDSLLPPPAVRVRLEPIASNGTRLLRVTTTVRIHEPIVNVTVSAACPSRLSRQFVVFVDPPLTAFEPAVPVAVEPSAMTNAPTSAALANAVSDPVPTRSEDAPARSVPVAASRESVATRPVRQRARSTGAKVASTKAAVTRPSSASARKSHRGSSIEARAKTPRLELERGVGVALAAPIAAAASAAMEPSVPSAAAAGAAAAADSEHAPEAQREAILLLQQRLEKLQAESDVSTKSIAQLQARLRDAEAARSAGWQVYGLMAVVAGLLLWIGLQTRRHASVSRHGAPWWNADAGPASNTSIGVDVPSNPGLVVGATAGLPEVVERPDDMPPTDSVPLVITERPLPSDAPRASQVFGDTVASVGTALTVEPVPASRLTADELIDLEQQAAFFVALGQDDSAVDLLNAFLRGNGGASPLPYLQLLEIHRRRGEREAHERIRERYERRFGNSLPGWADELVPATSIEDHAEVIEQIESAWADPANAMRLIESMLVDGDRPAASFDLSSFGDLQFLYLLARSLRELDVPAGATVDLLLPLSLTGESLAVVDSTSSRSNAVESPADSICSTASNVDLELDFLPPRADPKPDE